ncbi:prepilin peptidase [Pontibacillus salicampi]|uniref:Prepilin peptidase n=1 Tax=Pontibacillus salicampi TaxID=1449801 RepID=A0ABV6LJG4_9BACI
MTAFLTSYTFLIGLMFGSFYNVVGLRVAQSEGFFSSRSRCPRCGHTLSWVELIPVVSFLLQRGKCRSCATRISYLYPLVEVTTAVLFVVSLMMFGFQMELWLSLALMSLFMIVFVSDMTYMIIPDKVLLFFLPIFVILRFLEPLSPWYASILGAIVGGGLLAIIIIVSKGGMGAGDMKLFALLGIVLGVKKVLLALFLSTLTGAVISGMLVIMGIIDRKKPIPFGPYIILGSIVAYLVGESMIDWYVTTLFR